MNRAFAELNHAGDRVEVHFRYDRDLYAAVKEIPAARFVGADKGGPFWLVPLDLVTARRLREEMGDRLVLGRAYKAWGKEATKREQNLQTMATTDDVPLKDLSISEKLPEMAKWLRPYQRADVKFMAATSCLNMNEQRLGKTPETIGAIFEADLENGPHLVIAPKNAIRNVWRFEVERWTKNLEKPHEVIAYHGDMTLRAREHALEEFWACMEDDWPVWFVTTAQTIRDGNEPYMEDGSWNSFTIDEYHKTGLPNASAKKGSGTKFAQAVQDIEALRRYGLSGTPMGGKPIKLWGGLHFIYPDQFTNKWAWARNWLEVSGNGFGQDIGGIQPGREDEFYATMAPYALRRLRIEVLPQLPEAQWMDVDCEMTPKQAKQYKQMADKAEAEIEEKGLNALGILAQYTRLKQFSDAYAGDIKESFGRCGKCSGEGEYGAPPVKCDKCEGLGKVLNVSVVPSEDSGKLEPMMEKLAEQGIEPKDSEGTSLAIVASQFSEVCEMISCYLNKKGIKAELITGHTKQDERDRIQMLFRDDGNRRSTDARVVVMTTTLGVGITLDMVENVHLWDETWVPDDQEQLVDRAVNTSRMHQIGVYVYRSIGTVEKDIQDLNIDKHNVNRSILDARRQGFKANLKKQIEEGTRRAQA